MKQMKHSFHFPMSEDLAMRGYQAKRLSIWGAFKA
jgi:hypothetical protein